MISLTSREQQCLARIIGTMASPLAHDSVEQWLGAVHRDLLHLFGADAAATVLPADGRPLTFSEEIPHHARAMWLERVHPRPHGRATWQRAARLGVFSREITWEGSLGEYLRSDYFNEFILGTIECRQHIGLAFPLSDEPGPLGAPQLGLIRSHAGARAFRQSDLELLRLLRPAFAAGVQAFVRLGQARAALAHTLDALADALLVCDTTGRILHANRSLDELIRAEPERESLYAELRRFVAAMPAALQPGSAHGLTAQLATATHRYLLRASHVDAAVFGVAAHMVIVERAAARLPTKDDVCARFGLTAREAAVALLLAQGLSNAVVADSLHISPHTARRHTERVLAKLRLRSRAEVAALLLSQSSAAPA